MPYQCLKSAVNYCVVALACSAGSAPALAAAEWVSIKTLPGFDDARAQLQALVNKNAHQTTNRLCVVGQKDGSHFQAEVYWPSESKLILWVPNINDPETLTHSRRYLDLHRDVRTNVGTSTYLLSRSFVKEVLQACVTKGDHFTIEKATATARSNG